MPVTLNPTEIRHRAHHFSKEFANAHYELGEAQNFIRGLCDVFGFSNKRLVSFEQRVKKLGGGRGRIDGFYPGKLLIEMKSRGEKLVPPKHRWLSPASSLNMPLPWTTAHRYRDKTEAAAHVYRVQLDDASWVAFWFWLYLPYKFI
jgi:hypothetical protein